MARRTQDRAVQAHRPEVQLLGRGPSLARQEQEEARGAPALNPASCIRDAAPWLLDPELGTCVVGSSALFEACRRADLDGKAPGDLDLAWALDVEAGEALLQRHGVFVPTTRLNRQRGTLALSLAGERVEITSFRGERDAHPDLRRRIVTDLSQRDMTIGALAWWLAEDEILDPFDGLDHWREQRVVAVGNAAARVREHPIRWLRYYRKALGLGFEVDRGIRKIDLPRAVFDSVPTEAIGAELRAALSELPSPGTWLQELYEAELLAHVIPELAPQFDGRPAGPIRHHPEIGQGLHLVLALECAVGRTRELAPTDAYAVRFAVLCHDLGKNLTDPDRFPSHHGHEQAGTELIDRLCDRLPGVADQATRRFAKQVAALHLTARGLRGLRPGTLADLYDEHFRPDTFRRDLFAMAVASDSGGRLGREHEAAEVERLVLDDIDWVCARCELVDAKEVRERHPDVERFRAALHEARAKSIRG
ncbi:MAG: hypothetical protein KDB80_05730 [Planctomycetes bacterium]|nr:hypothetical protein [Planctomycetota bacterium]